MLSSKAVRKSIARVMTVVNQNKKAFVREAFKDKIHKPLDIRAKKTRALRRKHFPEEAGKKTKKMMNKARHFPQRKYAVKA